MRWIDSVIDLILVAGVLAACGSGTFEVNTTAPSVTTGASHTCARNAAGSVYCWGSAAFGQLGDGAASGPQSCRYTVGKGSSQVDCSTAPIPVSGGLAFAAVSAGGYHTCAVTGTGEAWCWGANGSGELGNGSTTDSRKPVLVSGGLSFRSITAGTSHTCGVTTGGAAYCWGWNTYGTLGNGSTTSSSTPVPVSGGLIFGNPSLATSGATVCGVTTTGAAFCWGSNYLGQLGNGSATGPQTCYLVLGTPLSPDSSGYPCSRTPVAVSGGLTFAAVSGSCGLTTAGAAWCWGGNASGQLGSGSSTGPQSCLVETGVVPCSSSPVRVSGEHVFSTIGGTCGVTTTGAALCWGANVYGQLGTGSFEGPQICDYFPCSTAPVAVSGGLRFGAVSTGSTHACGRTDNGAIYCWGENISGQLGNGTTSASATPVRVSGL